MRVYDKGVLICSTSQVLMQEFIFAQYRETTGSLHLEWVCRHQLIGKEESILVLECDLGRSGSQPESLYLLFA